MAPTNAENQESIAPYIHPKTAAFAKVIKNTSTEYYEEGKSISNVTDYTYDSNWRKIKTQTNYGSKYETIEKSFLYPEDFDTGIYAQMVNLNILNPIIESKTKVNGKVIGGLFASYGSFNNNKVMAPEKMYQKIYNADNESEGKNYLRISIKRILK